MFYFTNFIFLLVLLQYSVYVQGKCRDDPERKEFCRNILEKRLCDALNGRKQQYCIRTCGFCTDRCEDYNEKEGYCIKVRKNGLCHKKTEYLRHYLLVCPRSCGLCPDSDEVIMEHEEKKTSFTDKPRKTVSVNIMSEFDEVTVSPTAAVWSGECVDKSLDFCVEVRKNNMCKVLSEKVKHKCPWSCGLCTGPCLDFAVKPEFCTKIKKSGLCYGQSEVRQRYRMVCARTCGLCQGNLPTTTATTALPESLSYSEVPCIDNPDKWKFCHEVRTKGTCHLLSLDEQRQCAWSCSLCTGPARNITTVKPVTATVVIVPGPCIDDSKKWDFCAIVRRKGMCRLLSYSLQKQCSYSCGLCSGSLSIISPDETSILITKQRELCTDQPSKWRFCAVVRKRRLCSRLTYAIQRECAKTCGLCIEPPSTDSTIPEWHGPCYDQPTKREFCAAVFRERLCHKLTYIILRECARTCGLCKDTLDEPSQILKEWQISQPCKDKANKRYFCDTVRKRGICETLSYNLLRQCALSCGLCRGVVPTKPSVILWTGPCVDHPMRVKFCTGILKMNMCDSLSSKLRRECAKSCQVCRGPPTIPPVMSNQTITGQSVVLTPTTSPATATSKTAVTKPNIMSNATQTTSKTTNSITPPAASAVPVTTAIAKTPVPAATAAVPASTTGTTKAAATKPAATKLAATAPNAPTTSTPTTPATKKPAAPTTISKPTATTPKRITTTPKPATTTAIPTTTAPATTTASTDYNSTSKLSNIIAVADEITEYELKQKQASSISKKMLEKKVRKTPVEVVRGLLQEYERKKISKEMKNLLNEEKKWKLGDKYCKNRLSQILCKELFKSRLCETDPAFMFWNCPETCGRCDEPPPSLKPDPLSRACQNQYGNCVLWAAVGECLKLHERFMRSCCSLACGMCLIPCNNIVNDYTCNAWAKAGHCISNRNFMLINCSKSCNRCVDETYKC